MSQPWQGLQQDWGDPVLSSQAECTACRQARRFRHLTEDSAATGAQDTCVWGVHGAPVHRADLWGADHPGAWRRNAWENLSRVPQQHQLAEGKRRVTNKHVSPQISHTTQGSMGSAQEEQHL